MILKWRGRRPDDEGRERVAQPFLVHFPKDRLGKDLTWKRKNKEEWWSSIRGEGEGDTRPRKREIEIKARGRREMVRSAF